jgi:hypothetical protein
MQVLVHFRLIASLSATQINQWTSKLISVVVGKAEELHDRLHHFDIKTLPYFISAVRLVNGKLSFEGVLNAGIMQTHTSVVWMSVSV